MQVFEKREEKISENFWKSSTKKSHFTFALPKI